MSFLSPIFLALASAALVPLLIHLMRRRIGTRVEFPAARYLVRAEKEHSRKLRLRNLLLMLLRVLAVLLLALAAARPVGRLAGAGHAPTAVAIVLDNSLSSALVVDGRPVLEDLRTRARAALARATSADRVWLITADGRVAGGSTTAVTDALGRVAPLAGAGAPRSALAQAASLVAGAGLPAREIALLTDGQASAWAEPVSLGETRVAAWTPGGAVPRNRAVIDARAEPVRWTPRGAVMARVLSADSATYRITVGDAGAARTLARGTAIPSGASSTADVIVRAAPAERGWVAGSVELEPDELRGDDVRWFAAWIGDAPLVELDPGAGVFARSALDAIEATERVREGPGGVVVVPAERVARGSDGSLRALVVAPSDPVRIGAANRSLERAGIPWRYGARRRGPAAVRGGAATALDGIGVADRYALVAAGAANVDTLAVVGGEPWIVAGDGYVLVGSPLDPAATDLPARAAFVPWLADVLSQRLGGATGAVIAAAPAARVARPSWADALLGADGVRRALDGDSVAGGDREGGDVLLRGAARVGVMVVNPEPEESDLRRLSPGELRQRIDARHAIVESDDRRWSAALFGAGTGRPLVLPLIIAASVVLLIEGMVAAGGARGAAGAAGATERAA